MDKKKTKLDKNFIKLTHKGVSLILLIVTVIVVIILAAVIILTINKKNPVNSAKWILNTESEKIGTEEEKYKENLIDANSISLEIDEINT